MSRHHSKKLRPIRRKKPPVTLRESFAHVAHLSAEVLGFQVWHELGTLAVIVFAILGIGGTLVVRELFGGDA